MRRRGTHRIATLIFMGLWVIPLARPVSAGGANPSFMHPVEIGFDAGFTNVGAGDSGSHAFIPIGHLNAGFTLLDFLSLGITHVHLATTTVLNEQRWAWGLAPTAEGFFFPLDWLQVAGQLGLVLQHRLGADLDAVLGVTPFAGAGCDAWLTDWFSIGLGARLYVVAAGGHLFSGRVLPQGSLVGALHLNFGFHLGSRSTAAQSLLSDDLAPAVDETAAQVPDNPTEEEP